jgi:exo-beta-1,3-glucanase (GH17 family)
MPQAPSPTHRRHALTWLLIVIAAVVGAWWWWSMGRPVELPDAPSSRIACVSYGPFRRAGESPLDPKAFISPERVDADLSMLSHRFDCVRTYSQGQGLSAVPEIAARHGMKVLMGIWLSRNPKLNDEQIRLGIAAAKANPQAIRGIIVGNEVLLRGELSSAQIAGYLRQVKAAVSVPVTYADVWEFWLRHPELASSVDYITIHILPYWEDKPVPSQLAVQHVKDVSARVERAFPGRQIMIGETGWPSEGRPRQGVKASVVDEARYLREFMRYATTARMPYNVFAAFDQPWQRVLEGTVGGYWGIFDVNAKPKFPMQGPVTEEPHWAYGWLAGAIGAIVFFLAGSWRRRWKNKRGWLALLLLGFAGGCALAWQARQMWFACSNGVEWTLSIAACVAALATALQLSRWIAARLAGFTPPMKPSEWLRFGWLFLLTYFGLLQVFDGRYRDFPLGLFALPCIGYALVALLSDRHEARMPIVEERFLAACLPILAAAVVFQEAGVMPVAWLWLLLNSAIGAPVLVGWRQARQQLRLNPQQA